MGCLQKIQNFIPGGGARKLSGWEGAGVTGVVGCTTGGVGGIAGGEGAVGVTSCVGGGVA